MQSVEFLRLISWSRDDRDDLDKIYWSQTIAAFLEFAQETRRRHAGTHATVDLDAG